MHTFIFSDKTIIPVNHPLSSDQRAALQDLADWYNRGTDKLYLLQGNAGTGKSSSIQYFLVYLLTKNLVKKKEIKLSSPTHKANKELYNFVSKLEVKGKQVFKRNKQEYSEHVFTTAAAFTVKVEITDKTGVQYKDTKAKTGYKKLQGAKIWVIDEISMIDSKDPVILDSYRKAIKYYQSKGVSIIFMGDNKQLTNPGTSRVSPLFDMPKYKSILTQEVRQGDNNPLTECLKQLKFSIENNTIGEQRQYKTNIVAGKGVYYSADLDNLLKKLFLTKEYTANRQYTKVITRSNAKVKMYNELVREFLFGIPEKFEVGDTLMGYEQKVTGDNQSIFNGQEYIVTDVKLNEPFELSSVIKTVIPFNEELKNFYLPSLMYTDILTLKEDNPLFKNSPEFVVAVVESTTNEDLDRNKEILQLVSQVLEKILFVQKQMFSVPFCSGSYFRLLDTKGELNELMATIFRFVQFKSTLYKHNGSYISEEDLTQEITKNYKGSDPIRYTIEELKQKSKYLDKTIDYGYAITVNKAQGSTYVNPIIDLEDIEGSNDYWYKKDNMNTLRLNYVASSRASKIGIFLTDKTCQD